MPNLQELPHSPELLDILTKLQAALQVRGFSKETALLAGMVLHADIVREVLYHKNPFEFKDALILVETTLVKAVQQLSQGNQDKIDNLLKDVQHEDFGT